MTQHNAIKLFEEKRVRTVWDDQQEKWYFSVVDVVSVLTDSANPTDYLKKMRKRDPQLAEGWGQIVTPLSIQTTGGKQKVNFADTEAIFRIIQSIPSPKESLSSCGWLELEEKTGKSVISPLNAKAGLLMNKKEEGE